MIGNHRLREWFAGCTYTRPDELQPAYLPSRTCRHRQATMPGRAKNRRKQRAFTLLEVLVSATILYVGIAGSLSGFQTVTSVYRNQRHMTQALQIAQGVAEELLSLSLADEYLTAGVHPDEPWQYGPQAHRVSENGSFLVNWKVTPNVPVEGIRRIDVRVVWEDSGEHDFSLTIHR